MPDRDEELARAIRDLTATLESLQEELTPRRRRRIEPPTPADLLRFADDVAVPTAIVVLETNLKALRAFERALAIARKKESVQTDPVTKATSESVSSLRKTSLSQLDTALSELQRAVSSGTLPEDDSTRDLLSEARRLRADVERRLESAADNTTMTGGRRIEIQDADDDDATDGGRVDVDAELETLKDEFAPEVDDGDDTSEDDDGGKTTDDHEFDSTADTSNEDTRSEDDDSNDDENDS